jgi:hypothetical protein
MVGLSLTQLFYDQFGIEFGKENRKQWLEARNKGKTTRRTLTDAIMDYIEVNQIPSDKAKWVYSNASDALNKGLFGLTAKRLREFYGCKPHELRDCFDKKELHAIESVEYVAVNLVDSGMEPTEAVKETLARTLMAGKFSQKYLSA